MAINTDVIRSRNSVVNSNEMLADETEEV